MEEKNIKPALLFIPDICGFTQFVNEMEISHSQHIIEELLESLIDANELDMKVMEIEGDAIFFYLLRDSVSPKEIASQSRKMFLAFHQQLRKYELSRICDCGACTAASRLTLKVVAHQGNVTFSKVKDYVKLFGSDVILVHRLLKNDIVDHEYLLTTNSIPLVEVNDDGHETCSWVHAMEGQCSYDVGDVKYWYSRFSDLYGQIQDEVKPAVKRYQVKNPWKYEVEVNTEMQEAWETLIDLPRRTSWMTGVKEVVVHDAEHNRMNKIGTRHECIREDMVTDVITSHYELTDNGGMFSETAAYQPMTCDYLVEKKNGKTLVTIFIHLALKFPKSLFAKLFMKKKLDQSFNMVLAGFKTYCETQKHKPVSLEKV